jgi:hypothetical protein
MVVTEGGDDVMRVTANPPQLRVDSELIFAEPPVVDRQETADPIDRGHGRSEPRRLTTSQALRGSSAWPGLAPGFELERAVIIPQTGEVRSDTVDGVTRLASQRATLSRV